MIDPITQIILESYKEPGFDKLSFTSKMSYLMNKAKGLPGGKEIRIIFKKEDAECTKKETLMKKQGKKDEAFVLGHKCYTAAVLKHYTNANNIIKKHGSVFCNKLNPEKKKICLEKMKAAIRNHNHQMKTQVRDMKIEIGNKNKPKK